MNYGDKLKDPRWQKKRLEVFERDEFECLECGSKTDTLHVHHLKYGKGEPWEVPMEYLETLCQRCHDFRTAFDQFWVSYWSSKKCVVPTYTMAEYLCQLSKLSDEIQDSIENRDKSSN